MREVDVLTAVCTTTWRSSSTTASGAGPWSCRSSSRSEPARSASRLLRAGAAPAAARRSGRPCGLARAERRGGSRRPCRRGARDRHHDRQAEAERAAAVAGAAHEALEQRSPPARAGCPGRCPDTSQLGSPVGERAGVHPDLGAGRRVAQRVLDQVDRQAVQLVADARPSAPAARRVRCRVRR